jgi:hypothetical protein
MARFDVETSRVPTQSLDVAVEHCKPRHAIGELETDDGLVAQPLDKILIWARKPRAC